MEEMPYTCSYSQKLVHYHTQSGLNPPHSCIQSYHSTFDMYLGICMPWGHWGRIQYWQHMLVGYLNTRHISPLGLFSYTDHFQTNTIHLDMAYSTSRFQVGCRRNTPCLSNKSNYRLHGSRDDGGGCWWWLQSWPYRSIRGSIESRSCIDHTIQPGW